MYVATSHFWTRFADAAYVLQAEEGRGQMLCMLHPATDGLDLLMLKVYCRLNKAAASRMASAELPLLAHLHAAKLHAEGDAASHLEGPVSMEQD